MVVWVDIKLVSILRTQVLFDGAFSVVDFKRRHTKQDSTSHLAPSEGLSLQLLVQGTCPAIS